VLNVLLSEQLNVLFHLLLSQDQPVLLDIHILLVLLLVLNAQKMLILVHLLK
jgi:hypothetical protein